MREPYWPDRARILLSYAYMKSTLVNGSLDYARDVDVLIDSGAFTAMSLGWKISRSEYTEFLIREEQNIDHAASLDVIGDWRASAKNYDWMRNKLDGRVSLVPTWHIGSPTTELDRLCREHPYVAIGGCVPYAKQPKLLMRHLVQAHRTARTHGTDLHGLGITGRETMTRLPWASVDSTSWQAGHRFGGGTLTDEHGRQHKIQYGRRLTPDQRKLIRAYDGDPARVQSRDFNLVGKAGEQGRRDRIWSNVAAARAYLNIEGPLRARNGTQFRLYLVGREMIYVREALEAHTMGSPWATRDQKRARLVDGTVDPAATVLL